MCLRWPSPQPFGVYGLSNPSHGQSAPAKAAPAKEERGLEGSWSGGGSVSFASGSREQARCRAHYSRASKNSYRLNATCATASGKAAQIATVHKIGENKYSGNFHNPDYDISGTISVIVQRQQPERAADQQQWLGGDQVEPLTRPRIPASRARGSGPIISVGTPAAWLFTVKTLVCGRRPTRMSEASTPAARSRA